MSYQCRECGSWLSCWGPNIFKAPLAIESEREKVLERNDRAFHVLRAAIQDVLILADPEDAKKAAFITLSQAIFEADKISHGDSA